MDEDTTDHLYFKTIASCVIWDLSVLGCVAPMYMPVLRDAYNGVSTIVVGGIFLVGSVAHVVPALVETARVTLAGVDFMIFPTAYSLYALGYLFVLGLEVVAHWVQVHVHSPVHKVHPSITSISTSTAVSKSKQSAPSSPHPSMSVVVLFGVLSLHALLEGVGVGIAAEPAWTTLSGILAHKTVSSLVLSIEIHHHYSDPSMKTRRVGSLVLFSAMTPTGVLLGSSIKDPALLILGLIVSLGNGIALHRVVMGAFRPPPRHES
ncbi:hypothetical protein AaE_010183 [Aphanomyces astaci]|uniref:Uncharacterized protein n=2 Tax=Aphanomyces astaci TaxID=112090 RepID=A0A397E928_APHAT|nr:hypothetical protein AaE_010183 [Aphanomyces astaci]RHY72769.1 hypothetical protein DYB34_011768 [Aphanomyces astaci]RHY75834.1 hypothetical protein DYB38_010930 [Aphanomyces astaci]